MSGYIGILGEMETFDNQLWEKPRENESKFYVDTPFQRTLITEDEKDYSIGDIELRGYGSTWMKDRDDEYVSEDAFQEDLPLYLRKNPIMLWQHNRERPIGQVKNAEVDQNGLGVLGWQPVPHEREPDWKHLAYHSVKSGIVRTFSIGGFFERELKRKKTVISRVRLMEISVVSIPANPDSIFEAAVKAVKGSGSRPRLTSKHVDQMTQILGAREMTDPELLIMNEMQLRGRYDELVEYYGRCGKRAPEYEEWHELAKETLSSKGLEALRGRGPRVVNFMRKVQGVAPATDEELKKGRVLSAKNEENLKRAAELINTVVASVDPRTTEEEEDAI